MASPHPIAFGSCTKSRLPFVLLALATLFSAAGCRKEKIPKDLDFRAEMRAFVMEIAASARLVDPDFIVIPQNGQELVSLSADDAGTPAADYLTTIDGIGREDLWYGYDKDDQATPATETAFMREYLDLAKANGVSILVTDYCSTASKVDHAYAQNLAAGYVGFAAHHRELDAIPSYPSPIPGLNADTIRSLDQARNFLYLINPEAYATRQALIDAVTATNYDALIMDLFDANGVAFSAAEIEQLRAKANGGRRLVICYMSIGEAEDYRFYWDSKWKPRKPFWIEAENPDWKGNYKVWYWEDAWKAYIYGSDGSYLDRILDAGFDGTYLDIIDGFEFFESK